MKKILSVVAIMLCLTGLGCRKPYDVPEFENIESNETGFLVPLEGATSKQVKFESLEYLESKKVGTKRVQITKRWNQTNRWECEGEWIPNVKLIKVNRSPMTREWTADKTSGTSTKDQAIWAESKDSVGFSIGFTVTAMIAEEDTAQFLYLYPAKSIANILDTEIRARVQSLFFEKAAEHNLSELRSEKTSMALAIRDQVTGYFKGRGITITTLGMLGGLTYENPEIQKSIDRVFITQREKDVSKALKEAQEDKNEVIRMEAKARADAAREVGRGEAEAKKLILEVATAAADNPVFLEMRRLEVADKIAEKWDGKYPTYMMTLGSGGGANSPTMLLNMPSGK